MAVRTVDANSEMPMEKISENRARKYARNASYTAVTSALVTALVAVYRFVKMGPEGFDVLILADMGIMLAFAYGIWRYSRICVIGAFAYYLVSQFRHYVIGVDGVAPGAGIVIVILFSYFYIQGIHGVFAIHSLRKNNQGVTGQ